MMIIRIIGPLYRDHVKALHVNFIRGAKPAFSSNPIFALQHALTPYNPREKDVIGRKLVHTRGQWIPHPETH